MFSVQQKREIADAVQKVLRDTKHPELPDSEIQFILHVWGAEGWSWVDIRNNGAVTDSSINVTDFSINPHNEHQGSRETEGPP